MENEASNVPAEQISETTDSNASENWYSITDGSDAGNTDDTTDGRDFDDLSQPEPEAPRKFKLKDGDNEEEVDEAELIRRATHGSTAQRRMEEAANLRKQAEAQLTKVQEALAYAKSNPLDLIRRLGHDPYELATRIVSDHIDDQSLTPQERQLRQERQELERYRAAQKAHEEEQTKKAEEAERTNVIQEIETGIMSAFAARGIAGDSELMIGLALDTAKFLVADRKRAHVTGQPPKLTYDQAVGRSIAQYRRTINSFLEVLDEDQIYELMGEKGKQKFRAADMRKGRKAPQQQRQQAPVAKQPEAPKHMSEKEYFDWLLASRK